MPVMGARKASFYSLDKHKQVHEYAPSICVWGGWGGGVDFGGRKLGEEMRWGSSGFDVLEGPQATVCATAVG